VTPVHGMHSLLCMVLNIHMFHARELRCDVWDTATPFVFCIAETIEAMQHPRKSYCLGFLPLFFMIVPPGIMLNVAFAKAGIATAGE